MGNFDGVFTRDLSLMDINPFVRHVNKIYHNKGEKHGCPKRQLYDFQLICVVRGEMQLHLLDKTYSIKSEDAIILPPNITTKEKIAENTNCMYFIIHFDFFYSKHRRLWSVEDMYLKYCRPWIKEVVPDPKYRDKDDINNCLLYSPILFETRVSSEGLDVLQRLYSLYCKSLVEGRNDYTDVGLKSGILNLFSILGAPSPKRMQKGNVSVYRFVDYVKINYANDINVKEFAEKEGYTINYYRKIFKNEMGVTPSEFLRDIRIAKAKELLLIDLPVSRVAESVGYLDQFYFSKLFKKETGVSPKDYKKSVKNID